MKICIDLTALSYHMSGIERYALNVTEEILSFDRENFYILVFRKEIYKGFLKYLTNRNINTVVINGSNKLWFNQVVLPIALYKIHADKYLFLAFTSPFFFKRKGIINTIHDMGCWDTAFTMTVLASNYFKILYRKAAKISEKILTVSEFSKGRIHTILKYPAEKIIVTYNGVSSSLELSKEMDWSSVKKKYLLPDKYVMNLSTLEPRKNLELLIKAFLSVSEDVNYDLVLIGRKGWKIEKLLKKYGSSKRIHITGFVEDKEIVAIYKNSMCFIFTSLYEGFGIPPIEALAQGTPVISSDAACMPEILKEQAIYFKNNNISDLKEKLLNLDQLVLYAPKKLTSEQKMLYSYSRSAKKIISIY